MNITLSWALLTCVTFGGPRQGDDAATALLERLSAASGSDRIAAAGKLARLAPGKWVAVLLAKSRELAPEAQRQLEAALALNTQILAELVAALAEPKTARPAARVLRAYYDNHAPPAPGDPDLVSVLPARPLLLDGVRNLLDLYDRLLVTGSFGLPLVFDARLDHADTYARTSLAWPPGAPVLREILPPMLPATSEPRLQRVVTRVGPRGLLVTDALGPRSLDDYFPQALVEFLGTDPRIGRRAAMNLATLDVPAVWRWLETRADGTREAARRARLGLAVAYLRGARLDTNKLAPEWLAEFRDVRAASANHGDDPRGLVLGAALRAYIRRQMASGREPNLLGAQPWTDDALAELLAGIPAGRFERGLEAAIAEGKLTPRARHGAILALRRARDPLPEPTVAALRALVQAGAFDSSDTGIRRLDACLELLDERGGDWLPRDWKAVPASVIGGSNRRGALLARSLARAGQRGARLWLATVRQAKSADDGVLGLLGFLPEAQRSGQGMSVDAWRAEVTRPGLSDAARLVMQLAIGEIAHPRLRSVENRHFAETTFAGLVAQIETLAERPELERRLGRALGRLLLTLPTGPMGKQPAEWLASWIGDRKTRRLGLAAAELCLPLRPSLQADIQALYNRQIGTPASLDAVTLYVSGLRRFREARPSSLGIAPIDPLDPLVW